MEFYWNDGGRADSGYVGLTGDCVTRSIAVATGTNYRDVYRQLGEASNKSPRSGIYTHVASEHLAALGWIYASGQNLPFRSASLPKGVVIVHLEMPGERRRGHFCTVLDHVVHDTWNPSEEEDYRIQGYWTRPLQVGETTLPSLAQARKRNAQQDLTQKEFDRVLHLLRSLDNTANNHASTEGEKRNALRMMQNLMLRHNLSRDDIHGDDNVESMCFSRVACPVNGRRAYLWEKRLAMYLTSEIFPMTQWYFGTKGHRTLFWFYGPVDDVANCISLFRELLLTIATSAQLQYGGYSRGSGASYAEGYVQGLPRYQTPPVDGQGGAGSKMAGNTEAVVSETALMHLRTLAVHQAAVDWLKVECGICLVRGGGTGRNQHDPAAADRGKRHGASHDLSASTGRKRITAS